MADVREDILARLLAVLATIPTIKTAQRNNIDIPDELLPWAALFDGDEETDDANDLSMHPSNRPTMVRMHPEIIVVAESDDVGSELSSGAIRYLGCITDLHYGGSLMGGMRAQFMIKYVLKPDDL